jgi:hypothetical protein
MKEYEVTCANPDCGSVFTIDAEPQALAEDKGTISECPECEHDTEFDYDAASDTLTITPGQEDQYDDEEAEEGETQGDDDVDEE